jgi:hypothetical protein
MATVSHAASAAKSNAIPSLTVAARRWRKLVNCFEIIEHEQDKGAHSHLRLAHHKDDGRQVDLTRASQFQERDHHAGNESPCDERL